MAEQEAMTRFPVPDRDGLPEDVRGRIEATTEHTGFTPNFLTAMAYKPEQFRAFFDYYDALVHESPLAREEIEMLTVTVSGVNDCLYCVVAHGAILRIYSEDPLLADQLATNHRLADVNETHRAMCDFAVKVTKRPNEVSDADIKRLERRGFSKSEIWDIGAVAALFALSNRMALLADMRPNEEFYDLGRNARGEVVEDLADPFFALDTEGRLVDYNQASQRLVEGLTDDKIGEPFEEVFPELTAQVESFSGTESVETEVTLTRDGTERYYDMSIAPRTRGPREEQQGRLVVLRDVTLLKERERQLNLMRQVQSRVLRHNVRNDLEVIKGYSQMVADDLEDENAEFAETVLETANDLAAISDKARAAEKLIEEDQTPETVDLSARLRDIVSTYREEHPDVTFTLDCPEVCPTETLPTISIAFENLVENGAVHNDADDPTVDVSVSQETDATTVTISDNGSGIPRHELAVLEEGEETALEHGSGIGLWLVDWVIDHSSASISFQTESDGTSIEIRIPGSSED